MTGFWRIICAVALLGGCAGVEVNLAPEVDLSRYEAVRLLSPQEDPMALERIVAAELNRMGYEVLAEGPTAGGTFEVLFSYSFGPALDEQGKIVDKMSRFAVRFLDPDAAEVLAEAVYFSGGQAATAAEGIGAAFDKLGLESFVPSPVARKSEEAQSLPDQPQRKVRPAPQRAQDSSLSEGDSSSETRPSASPAPEPPKLSGAPALPSSEAESQGSQWVPRLQSWGLEKWGKE